jgi:hypothetical protein
MNMLARSLFILALAWFSTGCTYKRTVAGISTDYNRAMANTRDEQLLINVLRASGREPLMFSAVGEVTGSAQDKLGLEVVAENVLSHLTDVIKPTFSAEGSTGPTVKVTPLSSKEFTEGILRPIKPETLSYFVNQGWDTEFLLPLVLAGYKCPNGDRGPDQFTGKHAVQVSEWGAELKLEQVSSRPDDLTLSVSNEVLEHLFRVGSLRDFRFAQVSSGDGSTSTVALAPADPLSTSLGPITLTVSNARALEMARAGRLADYKVRSVNRGSEPKVVVTPPSAGDITLVVKSAEALEMLREGVAGGYKVKSVKPGDDSSTSIVTLGAPDEKEWTATFSKKGPCGSLKDLKFEDGKASLQLRSVEGIIYYLGASYRPCYLRSQIGCKPITYRKASREEDEALDTSCPAPEDDPTLRYLFRLDSGVRPRFNPAIDTRYDGRFYWVNKVDRCDVDRTLKTLSFLSQLIALQTNASDLAVTPSVIAIGGR